MGELLRHLTPLVQQGNLVEQLEDVIDDKTTNEVSVCQATAVAITSLISQSMQHKTCQAEANTHLISYLAWESTPSLAGGNLSGVCYDQLPDCHAAVTLMRHCCRHRRGARTMQACAGKLTLVRFHCRLHSPCTHC